MVRAPVLPRVPFTLRYSSAEQTESGQTDSSLVPTVLFRIAREAWEGAGNASIRVIKVREKRKERKKEGERGRQKPNTETLLQFQSCADYRYRITLSEIISTYVHAIFHHHAISFEREDIFRFAMPSQKYLSWRDLNSSVEIIIKIII